MKGKELSLRYRFDVERDVEGRWIAGELLVRKLGRGKRGYTRIAAFGGMHSEEFLRTWLGERVVLDMEWKGRE